MQKINFTKMVASGNDFIIIDNNKLSTIHYSLSTIAKQVCDRKYGVGADGLLILEKSKIADIKMRVFNADGSEAQMCGNGARCISLWLKSKIKNQKSKKLKIETNVGIIESAVKDDSVKIKLTKPKNIKLDIPIKVNNRLLKVNFINTGVPHTVIFVEGLDKIDVLSLGRIIRYHNKFAPRGTNVDFVEVLNNNSIKVRTYERGVEAETLACGTGAVAAALIVIAKLSNCQTAKYKINVKTKSSEILKVYFECINDKFSDVWLEGKVRVVYTGVYYV